MKLRKVGVSPTTQPFNNRSEGGSAFSELKRIVPGATFRVCPLDQLQARQGVEPNGKDIGRDMLTGLGKLRIGPGPVNQKVSNDQERPLVAQDVESGADGADGSPINQICICRHQALPEVSV